MFFINCLSLVCKSLFIPVTPQEQAAATSIQKVFRGYCDRKKVMPRMNANFLPEGNALRRKVDDYLSKQTPESLKKVPRASAGNTPVYFPPEFPEVVLKNAQKECDGRLQKMIIARDVCEEIQSTSLVIPKVRLSTREYRYQYDYSYLIEERLPIKSVKRLDQQQFYLAHLKEATSAIREFTHFVLRTGVDDLTTDWQLFTPGNSDWHPRYDNFPFLMHNGVVKIGLIDLEHMKLERVEPNLSLLNRLLYMYPYHASEILQVAHSYFSEAELKDIQTYAEQGKRFLRISCTDLLDFLKTKKPRITLEENLRKQIIDEIQKEGALSPKECKLMETVLTATVDRLNEIMQKTEQNNLPHYYFDPGKYSFNEEAETDFHELIRGLYDSHNPLVTRIYEGEYESVSLHDYLIQKLVDHKIIYRYVEYGMHGTMIA